MTSVFTLAAGHMAALGLSLLHFFWQALVIAALYKLVDMTWPRISAQQRYLLSLSALLSMLAVALATFGYEEWRLSLAAPEVISAVVVIPATVTGGFHFSQLIPVLDIVWVLGVVVLSLRTLGGLWFVSRLKLAAQAVPEGLAHRFAATVRRLDLTGKVVLRLHPAIDGPFVVGAIRSVIYLPLSALTALTPEQLDAVLSHELEHIRRADYIWNLVQSVIETLFFYHPVVWWLGSRLREQRELCCDDAALKTCRDPLTYATALLSLEEQRRHMQPRTSLTSLVMALNGQGSGKSLLSRIARVLGEKVALPRTRRPNAAWVFPVVLLTVMACVAPLVQVAASAHSREVKLQAEAEAYKTKAGESPSSSEDTGESDSPEVAATEMSDEEAAKAGLFPLPEYADHSLEPEAIAEQARTQALIAKAQLAKAKLTNIDVEAIVAQARAKAIEAKASVADGIANNIDVEAIAAEARAEAERAKADVARVAAMEIDPDKIAAEARQAAIQARQARAYAMSHKMRKGYSVRLPELPATPAPVAEPAAPNPPSPPSAVPAAPAAPMAYAISAPKTPKAPKPPKALGAIKPVVVTPVVVTSVVYKGGTINVTPLKGQIVQEKLAQEKLAYAPLQP